MRPVVTIPDPTGNGTQTYPPSLLRPLSTRDFVVTHDENEGSRIDFVEGDDGAIRFLRMDGRLYDPVPDEAPR